MLLKRGESNPEKEGACNIIETIIDMVIEPKHKGIYDLKVIYSIIDEVLIDVVEVRVI